MDSQRQLRHARNLRYNRRVDVIPEELLLKVDLLRLHRYCLFCVISVRLLLLLDSRVLTPDGLELAEHLLLVGRLRNTDFDLHAKSSSERRGARHALPPLRAMVGVSARSQLNSL